MRRALYRSYRPKRLDEVVGQEHITTTLVSALKSGQIAHAYLFTGPRGVGKTSIARILAHELNKLPYEDDSLHLDIIEIDAASNRRIDEIRDLRDRVHTAPTSAQYKVYIIDEVHMLTREAFNALLKTLEEPPAHVVFILATTEAHKVPDTIASRTQRFSFRTVPESAVTAHLATIAKKEKINIEPAALELIAAHGQGSFRDSIGLLDQLSGTDAKITADTVRRIVGLPPQATIDKLVADVAAKDINGILDKLQELRTTGTSPLLTAKNTADSLRLELTKSKPLIPKPELLRIIEALLMVPTHTDHETALELALLKHAISGEPAPASNPVPQVVATSVQTIKPAKPKPQPKIEAAEETVPKSEPAKSPAPKAQPVAGDDAQKWQAVLDKVKKTHNTLYSVLRMANIARQDDGLELGFKFQFHVKQISNSKNTSIIQDLVASVFGENLRLLIVVSENYQPPAPAAEQKPEPAMPEPVKDPDLANISNIFGPSEVLE